MKYTFPHMGNTYIPLRALVNDLGHEAIVPPPCSKKTLSLGAVHSPETACLPLKLNVGNYIEAAQMGADGVIMAGGCGPCRFGFYGEVQREILQDLGIEIEMLILEPPGGDWTGFIQRAASLKGNNSWAKVMGALKLAWTKFQALDRIEAKTREIRPVAQDMRRFEQAVVACLNRLDYAMSIASIKAACQASIQQLESERDYTKLPRLNVGLVGEIYTLLEPYVNLHIERLLGQWGVRVHQRVQMGDWVKHHLLLSFLRPWRLRALQRKAGGYLSGFVGGHGLESVAHSVEYAEQGLDGVVHLLPFTCMPEIVAQSILSNVSRDTGMPIMTLVLDEQTGEAGYQTRIEAFLDLLSRKTRVEGKVAAG